MKKYVLFMLTAIALVSSTIAAPALAEGNQPPSEVKNVQLTETQKAELKQLHKDVLEKKKELIQKYVEFGVISKEMGDRIIQRYDDHYKLVEQNGFRLHHHPAHHKHQKFENQPD
jgi:hypothetical protein